MRRYLIGEVCAALGLKPHVLRYWEQQIGILSPAKNRAGRRVYTPADVQTLFRIKYLVHQRRFTLEGAAQRILEESGGTSADAKARIQQLRQDLLEALGKIRASDSLLAAAQNLRLAEPGADPAPKREGDQDAAPELEWFRPGFQRRSGQERVRLRQAERLWMATARIRTLVRALDAHRRDDLLCRGRFSCTELDNRQQLVQQLQRRHNGTAPAVAVQFLVFQRRVPAGQRAPRPASAELATREARAISAHIRETYSVESEITATAFDKTRLLPIPHLGDDGEPVLAPECRLSLYWSPRLTVLEAAQLDAPDQLLLMVPEEEMVESSAEDFSKLVIGVAAGYDAVAQAYRSPASGAFRTTGAVAIRAGSLPAILSRLVPRVYARAVERLIPGVERDDIRKVEVFEYRVTPTSILRASDNPAILRAAPNAARPADAYRGTGEDGTT